MTVTNRRTQADVLLAYLREVGSTTETTAELAAQLNVHPATVKRLIATLTERGYITVDRRYPDPASGDFSGRTLTVKVAK